MNKIVAAIVSLGLVVTFAAPTMAAPTTKAACEKAKMSWDDATKKSTKPDM
jgi:hypothetical protein